MPVCVSARLNMVTSNAAGDSWMTFRNRVYSLVPFPAALCGQPKGKTVSVCVSTVCAWVGFGSCGTIAVEGMPHAI